MHMLTLEFFLGGTCLMLTYTCSVKVKQGSIIIPYLTALLEYFEPERKIFKLLLPSGFIVHSFYILFNFFT